LTFIARFENNQDNPMQQLLNSCMKSAASFFFEEETPEPTTASAAASATVNSPPTSTTTPHNPSSVPATTTPVILSTAHEDIILGMLVGMEKTQQHIGTQLLVLERQLECIQQQIAEVAEMADGWNTEGADDTNNHNNSLFLVNTD
jgi:hypothetical protein